MLQIDFPSSDTYYSFTTPIEGATYTIYMQWMTRTEEWYMTVYDATSTLVASNIKIVPNFPLFFQKVSLDLDGDFIVTPITTATELTADNLADDWTLIYLSEEDIGE